MDGYTYCLGLGLIRAFIANGAITWAVEWLSQKRFGFVAFCVFLDRRSVKQVNIVVLTSIHKYQMYMTKKLHIDENLGEWGNLKFSGECR